MSEQNWDDAYESRRDAELEQATGAGDDVKMDWADWTIVAVEVVAGLYYLVQVLR